MAGHWATAFREVLLARTRTSNAQRDQVHVEPAGEVFADLLTETLGQTVHARRVARYQLFRRKPGALAIVDAHGAGVHATLDAHPLGGPQQQVQPERIDLVVFDDLRQRLLIRGSALRALHDHVDERVHSVQRATQIIGAGNRACDILDVAITRRAKVQYPQRVVHLQVRRDEAADETRATDEQNLHTAY